MHPHQRITLVANGGMIIMAASIGMHTTDHKERYIDSPTHGKLKDFS
ncbi:MAG: hypothetical protein NTY33_04185 [Candidatus Moranbacteria bacterium]|nr:hypothetical protein [Candidatus Moranbacteria bacterium]